MDTQYTHIYVESQWVHKPRAHSNMRRVGSWGKSGNASVLLPCSLSLPSPWLALHPLWTMRHMKGTGGCSAGAGPQGLLPRRIVRLPSCTATAWGPRSGPHEAPAVHPVGWHSPGPERAGSHPLHLLLQLVHSLRCPKSLPFRLKICCLPRPPPLFPPDRLQNYFPTHLSLELP